MKRTQVARECADALHATEASLEATLASSRQTLERLLAARAEIGLTGTVGDAGIARLQEVVATLEQAQSVLIEGHQEAYRVMQSLNLRTRMDVTYEIPGVSEDDVRAA